MSRYFKSWPYLLNIMVAKLQGLWINVVKFLILKTNHF